jgi:Tfp pilus assembly protein PilO
MDIAVPLAQIMESGLLGALLVLALLYIWWLQRKIDTLHERRFIDATTMKDAYSQAFADAAKSQLEANHKTEELIVATSAVAKSVEQLVYRREGGP